MRGRRDTTRSGGMSRSKTLVMASSSLSRSSHPVPMYLHRRQPFKIDLNEDLEKTGVTRCMDRVDFPVLSLWGQQLPVAWAIPSWKVVSAGHGFMFSAGSRGSLYQAQPRFTAE